MGTDIINKIESLNPKSFSDYEFLVIDLRRIITSFGEVDNIRLNQNIDFSGYSFRANSYDYIIELFNRKLKNYRSIFFYNEELIRDVIRYNPNILDKIKSQTFTYFFPLQSPLPNQGIGKLEYGPSDLQSTMVVTSYFKDKYNSRYYLTSKKPVSFSKQKQGCFIATFAYESYDHKNVIVLRKFRDETLSNSHFGKLFIRKYYKFSPSLVFFITKIKFPKSIIKVLLQGLILTLPKREK